MAGHIPDSRERKERRAWSTKDKHKKVMHTKTEHTRRRNAHKNRTHKKCTKTKRKSNLPPLMT